MRSIPIIQVGVSDDGRPVMAPAEVPFPPAGAVMVVTRDGEYVVYEPGDELPAAGE